MDFQSSVLRRSVFFEDLLVLNFGMFLWSGITECSGSRGCSRGRRTGTDEQPSPATLSSSRAPTQESGLSVPWRFFAVLQHSASLFPKASPGSPELVAGFWVWIFGLGIFGRFLHYGSALCFGGSLLQKIRRKFS